jgi:hypothetical protein
MKMPQGDANFAIGRPGQNGLAGIDLSARPCMKSVD